MNNIEEVNTDTLDNGCEGNKTTTSPSNSNSKGDDGANGSSSGEGSSGSNNNGSSSAEGSNDSNDSEVAFYMQVISKIYLDQNVHTHTFYYPTEWGGYELYHFKSNTRENEDLDEICKEIHEMRCHDLEIDP